MEAEYYETVKDFSQADSNYLGNSMQMFYVCYLAAEDPEFAGRLEGLMREAISRVPGSLSDEWKLTGAALADNRRTINKVKSLFNENLEV